MCAEEQLEQLRKKQQRAGGKSRAKLDLQPGVVMVNRNDQNAIGRPITLAVVNHRGRAAPAEKLSFWLQLSLSKYLRLDTTGNRYKSKVDLPLVYCL